MREMIFAVSSRARSSRHCGSIGESKAPITPRVALITKIATAIDNKKLSTSEGATSKRRTRRLKSSIAKVSGAARMRSSSDPRLITSNSVMAPCLTSAARRLEVKTL